MSGKDPTQHPGYRPPFTMCLTEEGKNLLKSGPVTLEYVSLLGRTEGGTKTHMFRTIRGSIIDVDALSVTISDPNPKQMSIHTITLLTSDNVIFARYEHPDTLLETDPDTPVLWTLNMHFSGYDVRKVTFANSLTDITGTQALEYSDLEGIPFHRVIKHEDLGKTPFLHRHPKMDQQNRERQSPPFNKILSASQAPQPSTWKIGDLRWSSQDLGGSWLPADGRIQKRAQFPDLATLSSTWVSPDLSKGWTKYSDVDNPFHGGMITSIAANDQTYVAVGCNSNSQAVITYSLDGYSWVKVNTAECYRSPYPVSVTWAPKLGPSGLFIMGGISATINGILTSPDGKTWTKNPLDIVTHSDSDAKKSYTFVHMSGLAVGSVFANNGSSHTRTVILDNNGNTRISDDGCVTWKSPSVSGIEGFTDRNNKLVWGQIGHSQGLFIAGGENSQIATSPDGITWTACPSATTALGAGKKITAMVWGRQNETAGTFIIASSDGTIIISQDAENWDTVDTEFRQVETAAWTPIDQGRKGFVVSGYNPRSHHFMVSLDGRTWDKITWSEMEGSDIAFASQCIHGIAYSNNRLLMGGIDGFLASRTVVNQDQFCLPNINDMSGIKAYIKAL